MPRISRTILPRIKKSLQRRGLLGTAWQCVLGPYYLVTAHRRARKNYARRTEPDAFDVRYGVETGKRVALSDLRIPSRNWIYSDGYWPTPPEVVQEALSNLEIQHQNFVFLDLGSGKGRVLLLASEFPFRRIMGIEFSPELNEIARQNIARYKSDTQKCHEIASICMDFTEFHLPQEPLFVFLYNPSSEEITRRLATNLAQSIQERPRELWVLYVTPTYNVFDSGNPLKLRKVKTGKHYSLFTNSLS